MKNLLLLLLTITGFGLNAQSVIYVNHAATGSNDGSSWINAFNEMQDAITNASTNDELWVAQGTYYPTEDIIGNSSPVNPNTKTILVNKDIAIYGGFNGTETLISQRDWEVNITLLSGDIGVAGVKTDNCDRIVFVTSNSSINGIRIKDAYIPSSYGGAINVNGSIFSLKNCIISDNETNSGPGMYIQNSSSIEVDNCKFYNNLAANKGGAIYLESGKMNVSNSVFDGNYAAYGGAIILQGNTPDECRIVNSLFINNETTTYGGAAVYAFEIPAGVKIINSTFAKNGCSTCPANNSGTIGSNGVDFIIQNSIVWDSIPLSESNNNFNKFTINNSIISGGFTGNNNLSSYPLFTDTTANDYTLQSGSVAINSGDSTNYSSVIPLFDLEGNSRYFGSSIDMGCFENQGVPVCTVNIPDANFKTYLLGNSAINTNSDNEIQCSEASAFTGIINCPSLAISDMTGIASFPNITQLICYDNQLSNLDVSNNTAMTKLFCHINQLTNLDVTVNTLLTSISFGSNLITSIDLSNNTALITINAFDNLLTSLDLSGLANLEHLFCENNSFQTLDLSNNTNLDQLTCNNNNSLQTVRINNGGNSGMSIVDFRNNPQLYCIAVDDVAYSTTNWTNVDDPSIYSTDCSCTVNIPDANFKAYLVSNSAINTNNDTEIQCSEASSFTGFINCGAQGITDVTGLEAFINLSNFDCSINNLTSIDVSANVQLNSLNCSNNSLTSIVVGSNNIIETLTLSFNDFTTLSLSDMDSLNSLSLNNNMISSLSLTNIPNLAVLHCDDNSLTSLDISSFPDIFYFGCSNNDLNSLNLANGNNTNFAQCRTEGNINLNCIEVDDAAYSNTSWTGASFTFDSLSSFSEDCISVGIADRNIQEKLTVYPNPASNLIQINTSSTIQTIRVLDLTGKTVKVVIPVNNTIDISDLVNGVYFLQIQTEKGMLSNKFIKE